MTGGFEYNVGLSLKRAHAVVKAVVNEYGIAGERLAGKGAGPLCPVGSNKNKKEGNSTAGSSLWRCNFEMREKSLSKHKCTLPLSLFRPSTMSGLSAP